MHYLDSTELIIAEETARAYFLRAYGHDQALFDDVWNRYISNYNGMYDHWNAVLPFILGSKEIPLNERRGQ